MRSAARIAREGDKSSSVAAGVRVGDATQALPLLAVVAVVSTAARVLLGLCATAVAMAVPAKDDGRRDSHS